MEQKDESLGGQLYEFRLYFNSRDPRQLRVAAWVHAVDVWSQIELVDLAAESRRPLAEAKSEAIQENPYKPRSPEEAALAERLPDAARVRLVTGDNQILTGYALFEKLVRSLRLLWPLAWLTWLPGFAALASIRYPASRDSRKEMSRTVSGPPLAKDAPVAAKKAPG